MPIIDKIHRYIEKSSGNKYLTLAPTGECKGILKTYEELWNKIRDFIRLITNNNDDKQNMKIKFNSDGNCPLQTTLSAL